jgi:hypothetical protein
MAFSFRKLYSDPSRVGLIEVGDSDSNWGGGGGEMVVEPEAMTSHNQG